VGIVPAAKSTVAQQVTPTPTPTPIPLADQLLPSATPEPAATPQPEPQPSPLENSSATKSESAQERLADPDSTKQTAEPGEVAKSSSETNQAQRAVKTELVITSTLPAPSQSFPSEKAIAKAVKRAPVDSPKPLVSNTSKPLFEPIIITIPKSEVSKEASGDENSGRPTLEIKNADGRERLIDGKPVQVDEPPPCQININQERLSLINNGGTLSVLVGVGNGNLLDDLRFVVSDPDDISVDRENDIAGIQGRSLYVIKSTSERTGSFRVTFYLPCGKKDVMITVR